MVILVMTVIQAIFGWYHHKHFVQDKPTRRRWFTHVHLWLGRALILGGSVNCAFGFPHLDADYKWAVKGWIVCGIVVTIYICLYILLEYSRKSRQGVNEPEGQISEVEGLLERRSYVVCSTVERISVEGLFATSHW